MSFSCSNRSRIVNFQGRRRLFQFYGSKTGLRCSLTFLSLRSFFTDWSSSFPPPSGPLSVTEIHQGIFCFFWPTPHTFRSFILLTHLADMVQTRLSGQDLAAPPPPPHPPPWEAPPGSAGLFFPFGHLLLCDITLTALCGYPALPTHLSTPLRMVIYTFLFIILCWMPIIVPGI